jgi:predicted lipoprotein with Yx(FWY)xxD motif
MRITWIAIALALTLAACGDDDATPTTSAPAPTTTTTMAPTTTEAPTTTTTEAPTTTAAPTTTVATTGRFLTTAQDADLGEILVDQDGMTVYLFVPDAQGDPTCTGSCTNNWPPVEDGDFGAGAGIDPTLLGTVERGDGSLQATYNGWPLYHYAPDSAPGDTRGQGIGGVWFVLSPAGDAVDG